MTFREKLQMEHPEKISDSYWGGCGKCPHSYGYCDDAIYVQTCSPSDENCRQCWDREIPGTEPTKPNEPTESTPKSTHCVPSGIEPTPSLVSVTLTAGELDSVIDYIECYLLQLIREDHDIDGLEWVANIMSAWRKFKDKQKSLDAAT